MVLENINQQKLLSKHLQKYSVGHLEDGHKRNIFRSYEGL